MAGTKSKNASEGKPQLSELQAAIEIYHQLTKFRPVVEKLDKSTNQFQKDSLEQIKVQQAFTEKFNHCLRFKPNTEQHEKKLNPTYEKVSESFESLISEYRVFVDDHGKLFTKEQRDAIAAQYSEINQKSKLLKKTKSTEELADIKDARLRQAMDHERIIYYDFSMITLKHIKNLINYYQSCLEKLQSCEVSMNKALEDLDVPMNMVPNEVRVHYKTIELTGKTNLFEDSVEISVQADSQEEGEPLQKANSEPIELAEVSKEKSTSDNNRRELFLMENQTKISQIGEEHEDEVAIVFTTTCKTLAKSCHNFDKEMEYEIMNPDSFLNISQETIKSRKKSALVPGPKRAADRKASQMALDEASRKTTSQEEKIHLLPEESKIKYNTKFTPSEFGVRNFKNTLCANIGTSSHRNKIQVVDIFCEEREFEESTAEKEKSKHKKKPSADSNVLTPTIKKSAEKESKHKRKSSFGGARHSPVSKKISMRRAEKEKREKKKAVNDDNVLSPAVVPVSDKKSKKDKKKSNADETISPAAVPIIDNKSKKDRKKSNTDDTISPAAKSVTDKKGHKEKKEKEKKDKKKSVADEIEPKDKEEKSKESMVSSEQIQAPDINIESDINRTSTLTSLLRTIDGTRSAASEEHIVDLDLCDIDSDVIPLLTPLYMFGPEKKNSHADLNASESNKNLSIERQSQVTAF